MARTFYRITTVGGRVPREGPVLVVANHPNSLLDPALVVDAAGRPMRFLARAGLFGARALGWLIRGSGSIPIWRASDTPDQMGRNRSSFESVWEALAEGACVGIFPEGESHSRPALVPIKTGAARIALGAAGLVGGAFPIVPVGLTYRGGKEKFRSEALLVVGKPIRWADLVEGEAQEEAAVVRELTRRIHAGLDRVTVSLEDWEDLPLIETAEAVHDAEFGSSRSSNPVRWLARMRRTARAVQEARRREPDDAARLEDDLRAHGRTLELTGLSPRDLHQTPRVRVAVRWTLVNLLFFGLATPLAAVGVAIFVLPYLLISRSEPRFRLRPDQQATYWVLGGAVAYGGWILLIALLAGWLRSWQTTAALLLVLPPLGLLTLRLKERWSTATSELRRFLFLRGRGDLRSRLLERQADLATAIRRMQRRMARPHRPPPPPNPDPP